MVALLLILISAILTDCLGLVEGCLQNLLTISLYAEQFMAGFFGESAIDGITKIFFEAGITLIVTKFIAKGFSQYVLWTGGDADSDPLQLLVSFFKALAIAINFPIIYSWLAQMITEFTNQVIHEIGAMDSTFTSELIKGATVGISTGIASLIFFICFFFLYIQFLTKGLEILILRIGFPFACVGLMDANDGVFRTYTQKFIQSTLGILIQIALAKMGVALMINSHIFWGLATMIMAIKTPKFLQEFIIVSGGNGGGMSAMYQSSRMFSMAKNMIKK